MSKNERKECVNGITNIQRRYPSHHIPFGTVMPKGDLIYPLSQHIGAPASPIVSVGDHVLKGQKIAEAGGFVSAPIHASVSGTVKAIEPHFNPTGSKVNCIVVENDGEYQEVEYTPAKPLDALTKEEILNLIGEPELLVWVVQASRQK
jgi:Na+-translocating ferredoxin:NAD+ oxidoreductase RnfC subunit